MTPGMAATFYFIRHGMCDPVGKTISGRAPGIHLNEEGVKQARAIGERLGGTPIRAIYSSPLERTRETAEPLARRLRLPVQTSEALLEIDYGAWTGLTLAELAPDPQWQHYNQFRSGQRIPGGELFLEVQSRVIGQLESWARRHAGESVALFSHCDVIRSAILHYLGGPVEFIMRLEIRPASISILHLSDSGPQLSLMNDTSAAI